MGTCFCNPSQSHSYATPLNGHHRLLLADDKKTVENPTLISPMYQKADIFHTIPPESVKEQEEVSKDIVEKFQSEVLIENEGEINDKEENYNKKIVRIEDFQLLKAIFLGGVKVNYFKFLKVIGRGSFGKVMLVEKKDNRGFFFMMGK